MKEIRKNTLWHIPLYYFIVSFFCFYLFVWLDSFCIEKNIGADGTTNIYFNQNCNIIRILILIAVFLIGGFTLCRRMTYKEIAISSSIISILYLLWRLFPIESSSMTLAYFFCLNEEITALLSCATGKSLLSTIISSLTPMIFVLFGQKSVKK